MKLALIQQSATHDRDANLRRGIDAAQVAARNGAQVICFAELAFDRFLPQYPATAAACSRAVKIPGPFTKPFSRIARDHRCVIVLNLFEEAAGQTWDSSPVIDVDGHIAGVTRMVHITEYDCFHEQGYYTPGDTGAPVYATGHGRIGVAICYDRHFPEYMRALALQNAELVLVPQAGCCGEWPEGLFEAELRVAAFQNGYFAALCNRTGQEDALCFAGESFVCDPAGKVIARAATASEEILYCDLDLSQVPDSHARKLFLRHRRPELYGSWI